MTMEHEEPKLAYTLPSDTMALAVRAHSGTSMVPERRAEGVQKEYEAHMRTVRANLEKMATSEHLKEVMEEEFRRYQAGYLSKLNTYLQSRSGVLSPMIAGPSNFPVAQMRKRGDASDRKADDLNEWARKARKRMERRLLEERSPQEQQDAEFNRLRRSIARDIATVIAIRNKIGGLGGFDQNAFKASTAGMLQRSAANGNTDAVRRALDFLREQQAKLDKPIFTPRHSIWKLGEVSETAVKEKAEGPTGVEVVATHNGARIERHYDDERTRIFFDDKPGPEVRRALKGAAWKWSPRNGTWQRRDTLNAVASAKRIVTERYGNEV